MGRIDTALQRAATEKGADASPPTVAGSSPADVFVSPWAFSGERPEGAAHAAEGVRSAESGDVPTPLPTTTPEVSARGSGGMALFRGFHQDLLGRIVAAPGAPPILAEQFRRLAATLHHAQLVQGTKVVMITSARPGDGKTLTAANLALTLSESYRRQVLLIDADLRRPSLHDVFRVPNLSGLNDGLKARKDSKLAVMKITETLTLLPAGRPDPDPMSTLTSPRMAEILAEGAARFDWVIVDTAPLGLLADAHLLSTMVDGALLVIRAGETPFAAVSKALEALGRDRVLGAVLNAVIPTNSEEDNAYQRYYGPTDETTPAAPSTAVSR
jgi:protein-tyrosine kinase